ncbi:MAG TPA: hypothetical protein VMG10_19480 [Gemmataceae bacterium]|nr:hypothetical protein [Gemmataceae bacterium]
MKRFLFAGLLLSGLGCAVTAERVPLQPLPETGQVLPYAELLTRVRHQATAANEAFYLDRWGDLEDMAKGIEQTARFLAKAQEVPAKHKDILTEVTGDLAKGANRLKDAAAAKNEKGTRDALQEINFKVRLLTTKIGDQPKQ